MDHDRHRGVVEPSITSRPRGGPRAPGPYLGRTATALLRTGVARLSGGVALLADTIHMVASVIGFGLRGERCHRIGLHVDDGLPDPSHD
jgi:hypothetical protein